jgi:hypothetical protein
VLFGSGVIFGAYTSSFGAICNRTVGAAGAGIFVSACGLKEEKERNVDELVLDLCHEQAYL